MNASCCGWGWRSPEGTGCTKRLRGYYAPAPRIPPAVGRILHDARDSTGRAMTPTFPGMPRATTTAPKPRISKKEFEARLSPIRQELVQLQVALKNAPFKVLLITAGVSGAGRGETINTLMGWLDPRGVGTFAFREPSDEERERPLMWRYWRSLPPRGRLGIYASSWYTETLREEAGGRKALAQLDHELRRIRHFEKLLSDNDTLVI